jgi:SHS2 domain-containing protein
MCQAPTDELLLVEWLNALIYEMAVRAMLFGDFAIEDRWRRAAGDSLR